MMRFILLFCVVILCVELNGQAVSENLTGKVSFVSSQNIYVKFKSTSGISLGDTLYISSNGILIPVLSVNNMSSGSCVCSPISTQKLSVDQLIIARIKVKDVKTEEKIIENVVKETREEADTIIMVKSPSVQKDFTQKIKGSISLNSYSDFSNTVANNSQRFRYTFSLDVRNIANSRLSIESYVSFKHKTGNWEEVKSNLFNALKIYTLAVSYDVSKTTRISLGRRINPRVSSIGAMDGLQVEKTFNKFALGAIIGSRPDYITYGFDSKLFQYGAYLAYNSKKTNTYSESSLAFMQQMNNSKTDRRFLYFQHSNSLLKSLYFFSTFEIDLYKLNNDLPQNTFNLTGLYLSLRYRINSSLSLTGSYDARKNVIYYETYKTFFERVLEDEMRQSYRLQASYRITKDLMFGLQSGYRFLKTDPHPSKNLYGYLTYSMIPGLKISATLSATILETSYLNGKIFNMNILRELFNGKFQTSLGYRYVDYRLPENSLSVIQNIGEMNISWQFFKNMSLSVNYEGTLEHQDKYNRIYFQIRKRF